MLINEGFCSQSNDLRIVRDIVKKLQRQLKSVNKPKATRNLNEKDVSSYGSSKNQDLLQSNEQIVVVDDGGNNAKASNELDLEKLLSNYYVRASKENDGEYQPGPKKQLVPNDLTGNSGNYVVDDSPNNIEGYSKIFIILNPKVLKKKSKYHSNLPNLVSEIISSFSSLGNKKPKSLLDASQLRDNLWARRYSRRDSREGRDSMEDDYKPKRQRADYGGGRLGAGRTAIPYIRQRGDIYERDN